MQEKRPPSQIAQSLMRYYRWQSLEILQYVPYVLQHMYFQGCLYFLKQVATVQTLYRNLLSRHGLEVRARTQWFPGGGARCFHLQHLTSAAHREQENERLIVRIVLLDSKQSQGRRGAPYESYLKESHKADVLLLSRRGIGRR